MTTSQLGGDFNGEYLRKET